MSDELSKAGKLLAGKEGQRCPDELSGIARQSKLTRSANTNHCASDTALATKCDDTVEYDEFYSDVLARFGIQI